VVVVPLPFFSSAVSTSTMIASGSPRRAAMNCCSAFSAAVQSQAAILCLLAGGGPDWVLPPDGCAVTAAGDGLGWAARASSGETGPVQAKGARKLAIVVGFAWLV
jgi:hypothetical protein